ncbi:MAG: four-carbon acid sugar kinase family protein [Deltaproteobacteria bacterium]|nr:four-carbon acid sugar kinase family protein [Deltaproteobacteria bacterium]MBW2122816.1 four-carbon acid sugar kinase family protein [Deltaproteobacteria bacterium]
MKQRCLVVADDLTGAVDCGARFARRGLGTLMVLPKRPIGRGLSSYGGRDVLVLSTNSRGLGPEEASNAVRGSLGGYDQEAFPVVYKKIDSTLRGNIGIEIDATLEATGTATGFVAPSYPEMGRRVVGGVVIVGEKPLSLTEAARDPVSPVKESYVQRIVEQQSLRRVALIDLPRVAAGPAQLLRSVEEERKKGGEIMVFDAFSREDLANIAGVAFAMEVKPLLVGSAGLAGEVAGKMAGPGSQEAPLFCPADTDRFSHVLIISGTMSAVTRRQLGSAARGRGMETFRLTRSQILGNRADREESLRDLSVRVGKSLRKGDAVVETCPERLVPEDSKRASVCLEIAGLLGRVTSAALEESGLTGGELALFVIGGDTTMGVFDALRIEGLEIEGEVLEGIGIGRLVGGDWEGLTVVTKAGAFGGEQAIGRVLGILKGESRRVSVQ